MHDAARATFIAVTLFASVFYGVTSCSAVELDRELLQHTESGAPKDRYTACLLLAEIPISDLTLNLIKSRVAEESDKPVQLCLYYVLARRTQEGRYKDRFIAAYPSGEEQKDLWSRHETAGNPIGVEPPPETYLGDLASQSREAMVKLVSGLNFADGAHAESLSDLVGNLYRASPAKVESAAQAAGVNISTIRK